MSKIGDSLKAAIIRMPVKDKDKLLLRLVAKDQKLIQRLEFELLEGGETRDERAADLRQLIMANMSKTGAEYLTPGYLLLEMRDISGRITEHVNATKDKLGDIVLNVFMLETAFNRHYAMLQRFSLGRNDTFAKYVTQRMATILPKAEKLDPDLHLEFRKPLNAVLDFIWEFPPTRYYAEKKMLPRKWM